MGRYFEYKDWEIESIANSIRERLEEARKPLPPKVMKHFITIHYKTGEGRYTYSSSDSWMLKHDEFLSREDAINFLNSKSWLTRIGDNAWVDDCRYETYETKDGKTERAHYEISESDCEQYADGEFHTEYCDEEIEYLSDALMCIEKARVYMKEYDSAEDNCSFGKGGSFKDRLKESLDKFENEYTESLPDDYYKDDDDY